MKYTKFLMIPVIAAAFASCGGGVDIAAQEADINAKVEAKVAATKNQLKADCDARVGLAGQLRADSISAARTAKKAPPVVAIAPKPVAAPVAKTAPAPVAKPAPTPVKKPVAVKKPEPAPVKKPSNTTRPGSNQATKPVTNTNRPGSNQAAKPATNNVRPGSNEGADKGEEKKAPATNTNRPGANK